MNPTHQSTFMNSNLSNNLSIPLQHQWCYNSQKRKQMLQAQNEVLHKYLEDFKANKKLSELSDFKSQFLPLPSKSNICMNSFHYYYVCRTCKQNETVKICQQCFDKELHKKHNYFTIIANDYCQCGLADLSQNICGEHPQIQPEYQITKPQGNQLYIVFLLQFFNVFISKDGEKRKEYTPEFRKCLSMMITLNQKNESYNHATAYFMSIRIMAFPFLSILRSFIQCSRFYVPFLESEQKLFKLICGYHPFQFFLLQSISDKSLVAYKPYLRKIVQKLARSPVILAGLAKKNIFVYSLSIPSVNQTYVQLFQSLMQKNIYDVRMSENIISIVRLLFNKEKEVKILLELNLNNKLRQFIYRHTAVDSELFAEIIEKQLEQKIYKPNKVINGDHQWFNMRVRTILYAVRGQIDSFPRFFKKISQNLIKLFVKNYFRCAFQSKYKCKFNILTAKCLFNLAKAYNFTHDLVNKQLFLDLNCLKFSRNLSIIMRNMLLFDHVVALELAKIAQFYHNLEEEEKYKKIVLEWFRNYLYLKKEVYLSKINEIKGSFLINFKQAKQILTSQTEYIQSKMKFIYKGPDRKQTKFCKFYNLKNITSFEQIGLFHTKDREQMLQSLFGDIISHIRIDKFPHHSNSLKQQILDSIIILDKLLLSKNPNIKNYIQGLKTIFENSKKKLKIQNIQNFALYKEEVEKKKENSSLENVVDRVLQESSKQIIQIKDQKNEEVKNNSSNKQLSQFQIQKNRKRNQKMNKIKQKFSRKSIKYSQHLIENEQKQELVCLICRQKSAKNKEKSFLFYLASLRNDELSQIIYGNSTNQPIITSCFHPYHQKCVSVNSSQFSTCILCKSSGNFIIPVVTNSTESQMFTKAWWDDFMSLAQFTPKQTNYSYSSYPGYTFNNLKSAPTKKEQIQLHPVEIQQRPFKNFIIIYRCLVLRLTSFLGNAQWEDFHKKIVYLYQLVKFFYERLTNRQKNQVRMEIEEFQNGLRSKKLTEFVQELSIIGSKSLYARLQGIEENEQFCEKIKNKCGYLIEKYPKKLLNNSLKNIEWLLNCKLGIEQRQTEKKEKENEENIKTSELLNYLLNVFIPQTIQELYEYRFKCEKCNKLQNWLCIFCKKSGCRRCMSLVQHCRNQHNNSSILMININSGMLVTVSALNLVETRIYFDEFINVFTETTTDNFQNFKCNNSKLSLALEGIFKKYF